MRGVLFGFRGLCLAWLAVGSIVCGWAGNASAQAPRFVGPYIGVEGGVLFVPNTTFNGLFGTTPSMTFNTGFQGAVDVGYNFGAFAAEGEFSYRRANTDQLTVLGTPFAASGNVNAFSVMGNGLININNVAGLNLPLSPFFGVGIGVSVVNTSFSTLNRTDIDDSDARFAWQILAGLRQSVTDNVDITVRYRFFNVDNVHMTDVSGVPTSARFRSHSILGGITFNFGAPPPPPPR